MQRLARRPRILQLGGKGRLNLHPYMRLKMTLLFEHLNDVYFS